MATMLPVIDPALLGLICSSRQVVAVLDGVLAAVHGVARGAGDEVAGRVEPTVSRAKRPVLGRLGAAAAESVRRRS